MRQPGHQRYRIYCAGPLFNASERAEMEMLAEILEQADFKTFLPHRDAFLFSALLPDIMLAGYPRDIAQWIARQAIFALDVFQVLVGCDGLIMNLNGRVPDEGGVAEAAIAWTAGKPIVLFKDDARAPLEGLDNPLVAGLSAFRLVTRSEDLARAMARALTEQGPGALQEDSLPMSVQQTLQRGRLIAGSLSAGGGERVVQTLVDLFDELKPKRQPASAHSARPGHSTETR